MESEYWNREVKRGKLGREGGVWRERGLWIDIEENYGVHCKPNICYETSAVKDSSGSRIRAAL